MENVQHDGLTHWQQAFLLLLRSGLCRTVLVGLHDEATPLYRSFIQRMGGTDLPAINAQAIVLSCGS